MNTKTVCVPDIPSAPLPHLVLCFLVRVLLDQKLYHRVMPVERSVPERRHSILRRTPSRQRSLVSNPPLRPIQAPPTCAPLCSIAIVEEPPPRPDLDRCSVLGKGVVYSCRAGDWMHTPIEDPKRGMFTTEKRERPDGDA